MMNLNDEGRLENSSLRYLTFESIDGNDDFSRIGSIDWEKGQLTTITRV